MAKAAKKTTKAKARKGAVKAKKGKAKAKKKEKTVAKKGKKDKKDKKETKAKKGKKTGKAKAKKSTVNKKLSWESGHKAKFVTDIGQFGYLYLLEPNKKSKHGKNDYSAQLMWDEEAYAAARKDENGKKMPSIKDRLEKAVVDLAKKATGKKKLSFEEIQCPVKIGNDNDDPNIHADKVYITAKRSINFSEEHKIFGPRRSEGELSEKEAKKLKAGDFGRLVIMMSSYDTSGGGIYFGLECVQLQQTGPALTGGVEASSKLLDDIDVELEDEVDPEDEEEDDSDDDEEEDEESSDDDEDDEEDEDEEEDDEEDDEDDEEEDDEEDEEEDDDDDEDPDDFDE